MPAQTGTLTSARALQRNRTSQVHDVHTEKAIYFKELVPAIVEAGKSKICQRAGWGRPEIQARVDGSVLSLKSIGQDSRVAGVCQGSFLSAAV